VVVLMADITGGDEHSLVGKFSVINTSVRRISARSISLSFGGLQESAGGQGDVVNIL